MDVQHTHRSDLVNLHTLAQHDLVSLAKMLRKRDPVPDTSIDYSTPVGCEERIGHLDGRAVPRLIIRLRSTGCEWVRRSGGCTMCGFYSGTSHGATVSDQDYLTQFQTVVDTVDLDRYPIVGIYNDGNFLNENEISMRSVREICQTLNRYPGIKKVVIESRINSETLKRAEIVKKMLNPKKLQVSFGFESANPEVMDLCVNKGFTTGHLERYGHAMKESGIEFRPLVLFKPPFLTEQEAIMDVLSTIRYCVRNGIHACDLEVTTVEKNTVVYELWKNQAYTPPMLWSLVDLITRMHQAHHDTFRLYISPWHYSVKAYDWTKNCGRCDDEVIAAIDQYNRDHDLRHFQSLYCSCRSDLWEKRVQERDPAPLPARVIARLKEVEREPGMDPTLL